MNALFSPRPVWCFCAVKKSVICRQKSEILLACFLNKLNFKMINKRLMSFEVEPNKTTTLLLHFMYSKNALYYTTTQPTLLIKAAPPPKIYDFEVMGERRMWNWLRVPLEKCWLKNNLWSDYLHVFKFRGFVVSGRKPWIKRSRADKHTFSWF